MSIRTHQSEMSLWLVNYGSRSLTGINSTLWSREIHTHGLCFSKWEKTYWKSDYNFTIIIKKGKHFRKNICLLCTWPGSFKTIPLCTQSLDGHRLHTRCLVLWNKLLGELTKEHVHLSIGGRKILAVLSCSFDWGKNQGFLTLVLLRWGGINSNYFSLYLLR